MFAAGLRQADSLADFAAGDEKAGRRVVLRAARDADRS